MSTLQATTSRNSAALGPAPDGAAEASEAATRTTAPLRIVLADDHALVRGGLVLLIKLMGEPIEILEANDLEQATGYLSEGPPVDLLLLDLLMPGMNGVEGVRRICQTWPDVPVVVVSVREDTEAIREALRAGAMGYIPKTSSPEVTTNALRFILAGGVYIPPHVLHLTDTRPEPSSGRDAGGTPEQLEKAEGGSPFGLTERQLEVLRLMAQGRSNKDIAADLNISPGTVKMHVSRIFKVLNVENRTQAASKLAELKAALGSSTRGD